MSRIMLLPPRQDGVACQTDARPKIAPMPAGANSLWLEKHEPVAIHFLHVCRHLEHRLCTVHQQVGAKPPRQTNHVADRRDDAERVRDLRNRHELGRSLSSSSYTSRRI
jgi:hypothetical protein